MKAKGLSWRWTVLWTVQAAVVAVLCWAVFRNIEFARLTQAFTDANPLLLFASIVPLIAERIARPYRLARLFGGSVSLHDAIAAQSVALFVNLVLPFRSGEVFLVALLGRTTSVSASFALSIVAIDRLMDLTFILLVFAVAITMIPGLPAIVGQAALLLSAITALAFVTIIFVVAADASVVARLGRLLQRFAPASAERWNTRLEQIISGFSVLRDLPRVGIALLSTLATWGFATFAIWLVMRAIWPEAPLGAAVLAICFAVIGIALISVPAGIGVVHAAYALAVIIFGASEEIGLAFAVLAHFLTVAATVAMGLVGMPIIRRAGATIWPRAQ